MTLADVPIGRTVTVKTIGGHGTFRRRLLELGLLPNTCVTRVSGAPLGDPLELLVRGASLSIRRADASVVEVSVGRPSVRSDAELGSDLSIGVDSWAGSTP
jgi:Fe2+ transport system protein FeoA